MRRLTTRSAQQPLPLGTLRSLPDGPGVYTFLDAAGRGALRRQGASPCGPASPSTSRARPAPCAATTDCWSARPPSSTRRWSASWTPCCSNRRASARCGRPTTCRPARTGGVPCCASRPGRSPAPWRRTAPADEGASPGRTARRSRCATPCSTLRRVFQIRSCRRRPAGDAGEAAHALPAPRPGPVPGALRRPGDRRQQYARARGLRLAVRHRRPGGRPGRPRRPAEGAGRSGGRRARSRRAAWEAADPARVPRPARRVRREYRPLAGGLAGEALVHGLPGGAGRGGALLRPRRAPRPAGGRRRGRTWRRRAWRRSSPAWCPGPGERRRWGDLDADQASILLRWIYRHSGRPECVPAGDGAPAVARRRPRPRSE